MSPAFSGQLAERGTKGPAGQQPANGDQQWARGQGQRWQKEQRQMPLSQPHADTMELDNTGPDTCRHLWASVWAERRGRVCVRARACTVKLIEHDGGEVDYHGDYNFLVTLWAPLHPLHACVHARMQFTCVFEYSLHDLILLQKDSWISHPSLA